jgi:DNA polymerase
MTMALRLDARQRAMLQEMGIAVWLPPHDAAADAGAPEGGPAAAAARAAPEGAAVAPPAVRPAPSGAAAVPDGAPRPPVPGALPSAGAAPAPAARTGAAGTAAGSPGPAPLADAGGSDARRPAGAAPAAVSRSPAAAPVRRPGDGPAAAIGAWQLLHDGAPRPAAAPTAGDGDAAAPAPRPAPPPRTWLLLTESSTPADLCAAQDAAGKLLAAMLRAVQHGGPVRIVGAPVRPAAAAGDPPGGDAAADLDAALREAVAQHRPALVLTLGRLASQAVLGTREPLGRLRGRLHADHPAGVPVVATYDAGYLLRAPADKARAWADLCLGLEQGDPPPAP